MDEKKMTLQKAIGLAGTKYRLAAILGVTRQAVQQWRELPELQQYRLREIKPEWFRD